MKKLSKIFALALAVLMLFALTATAFAADEPAADGVITISNATVDETYNIYKIFDLTYDANDPTKIAYTYTKTGETDNVFAALTATGSPFVLTPGIGATYSVTTEESAQTVSAWIKANLIDTKLIAATDAEKATSEEVKFENLEYGYYYITSTLGAVVTIDSAAPSVTVIDKNQSPSWDNEDGGDDDSAPGKVIVVDGKKVTENSVNVGDTVLFDIGINAVNYIGAAEVTFYYVSDEIEEGFEYVADEDGNVIVTVTVGGVELTDYTLTMGEDGQSFEIVIDWAEINADGELAPIYDANTTIHVRYEAVLTEAAEIAGEGNVNTANFTYKTWPTDPDNPPVIPDDPDDPDHPDNPDPDGREPYDEENEKETTTYTFALGFTKIDGETYEKIDGASFSVTDADGNIIYAKATETAGIYMFCDKDAEGAMEIFTTTDGVLVIEGVEEGKYIVTETAAPAGYNMLPAPVEVTAEITKVETYKTTYTTYYDKDGNVIEESSTTGDTLSTDYGNVKVVELVIKNFSGTELPATGGIGTYIFYIGGAVLLLGAAILLVVKKRMSVEE